MNGFVMLVFSISLTAQVFSAISDDDQLQLLKLSEKHVILNDLYNEYAHDIFTNLDEKAQHSPSVPLVTEMSLAILEEVLAGLIDQFVVIQLNVVTLACVLFYAKGAETPNLSKARKCHDKGILLSRYNEMLTAQMFIDAYNLEYKSDRFLKNEVVKIDTLDFARKLDKIKQNLKSLTALFTMNESYYSTMLRTLGMAVKNSDNANDEPTFEKGPAFLHKLWPKLWYILDAEYIDATNYVRSFMGLSDTVLNVEQFRTEMDYVEHTWQHILDITDIENLEYLRLLQEITSLKKKCFLTRMQMQSINIPPNYGNTPWEIVPITDADSYSDYTMVLLSDAPSDIESQ